MWRSQQLATLFWNSGATTAKAIAVDDVANPPKKARASTRNVGTHTRQARQWGLEPGPTVTTHKSNHATSGRLTTLLAPPAGTHRQRASNQWMWRTNGCGVVSSWQFCFGTARQRRYIERLRRAAAAQIRACAHDVAHMTDTHMCPDSNNNHTTDLHTTHACTQSCRHINWFGFCCPCAQLCKTCT